MIDGMLYLWFALTLISLIYMTYDLIWVTPEAGVMKLGWWLVTLYSGPVGLVFYLLSCKEPMPGTHEKFIAPLWKQAFGSMVHCLAGDVTGIILAALILAIFQIHIGWEITIEYLAGFFFGLFIFQSLFMKKMMGGTFVKALKMSFYPEFVSMNMIMSGMIPVMVIWTKLNPAAASPTSLHFWGKMSLATIVAGCTAFCANKWLVKNGVKHGMMTIRDGKMSMGEMHHEIPKPPTKTLFWHFCISAIGLCIGIAISIIFWMI